jgi:hypothetical protein
LPGKNDHDIKTRFNNVILKRLETPWTIKEQDHLGMLLPEYKGNRLWCSLIQRDHFPSKSLSSIRKHAQINKKLDEDCKKPWTDEETKKLESLLPEYDGEYRWAITAQSIHFPTKKVTSITRHAAAIKRKIIKEKLESKD